MEYSQRQIRRSPPAFQFGTPPPPDVPVPTVETTRPQRLLYAAAAAYLIVAALPPPDAPSAWGTQEFRPREIARAPSAAYWQFGRNPPEDVPETFGVQDQQPRPLPRAAREAYWRNNGLPPPDISENTLIGPKLALPQRLSYAGAAAYQINCRVPPEAGPATFGYQDQSPRALPRASIDAYQIQCGFVEPSLLSAANGWQGERSPPLLRASASAYWFDQRPTAEFNPDVPLSQGVQDQTPRPAARSASQAYFVEQRPIWLEPGQPVGRGFVDSQPRQLPRASSEAYQFINRAPSDQQPAAWGSQTAQAPAAQRAAPVAYWVEHVAEIQGPDKPAGSGFQANNVRAISRAAADAYRLITPKGLDEPEIPSGYQEHARRIAARASEASYWIEQRPAIYEPDRPVSFGDVSQPQAKPPQAEPSAYLVRLSPQIDERPEAFGYLETACLRARRPALGIYWIPQRSQAGEVGVPAAWGHVAQTARQPQRAANSAYAIETTFPPAVPPTPGQPVLPNVVSESGRASSVAYWHQSFAEIADPMPPGRGSVAEFARSVQRAPADAYQQQKPPQLGEELLIRGYLAQRAPAPQRASGVAYWIEQATYFVAPDAPAAKGFIADRAPAVERASRLAYLAQVSAPAAAEPSVFGFQSRPIPPSRAANAAYWVHAQFVVAEEPPSLGYIEPKSRLASRSSSVAYWLPQRWQTVGLDQPAAWGYQEWRSLPALRAHRKTYQVTATFSTPEIIHSGPIVQIYGSSGELLAVFGSDSSVVQVYGEESGTQGVRGVT